MQLTRVAFLWHHHQPDYREPASGRPLMPWVRLHALRGYRDLAVALRESGCPMTVNLVPSLLDQLEWYARGGDDPHLALTRRPAEALGPEERAQVLRSFVGGHPALFDAHPRPRQLRALRDAGGRFGVAELRDLQVWSTLAWVGWSGLRDAPELRELWAKGAGFCEDDKEVLLRACDRMVREIVPLYRGLPRAELSASAYYHPILPLLIDLRCARRNLPHLEHVDLPAFAHPDDAAQQLLRGRARVQTLLGAPVQGLWPSEGSVSPELVPLAARAGFRWLVSDEEVLRRSEVRGAHGGGPMALGEEMVGFFRDRSLSDAVGFRYAQLPARQAVDELIARLRGRGGVVCVALDGENPWEAWPNAGGEFMRLLMDRLQGEKGITPVTLSEAAALPPVGHVRRLHTGSWINADFRIWAGDPEDHAAWRHLARARAAVAERGDPPEALEHLLVAEGSDWFWWYGEQFSTPFALEFDRLFRARVTEAWRALGLPVPEELAVPVKLDVPASPALRQPTRPLAPPLDGRPERYFDWAGAGELRCEVAGGSMAAGATHLRAIRWGRDADHLYVRLIHRAPPPAEPPDTRWMLVLERQGKTRTVSWPYDGAQGGERVRGVHPGAGVTELGVPLAADAELRFHLALLRQGGEVARYPHDGAIVVQVNPGDWTV